MRQVIVFVNSSVDGFMGGTSGDLGWLIHDDEMDHDFTSDLRRTADTILSGRVVFESFAAAWPARAADRSGPPELVDFANWMLDTPKVVFSTGVTSASMKNSRISSRPIADEVAHLRDEAGGDMVVFGGARTVDAFVRLGLVDWRLVPTRANRQPAAAAYLRAWGDSMYRSFGFVVLGVSGVAISEITAFAYPHLFPVSGFASTLP